jgi:hypothetical protein
MERIMERSIQAAERRPLRRRSSLATRRRHAQRIRRIDLDAYYRAEQDEDIYRSGSYESAPIDLAGPSV